MRAMILAAGRGARLRPMTDHTPKPLIEVNGKPLIVHHLENLAEAGVKDVIINQGHLGEQLPLALGDGARWDLRIHWSDELDQALETGGGIFKALPLLGESCFLVINGDIWTDYSYDRLIYRQCEWAHLVMVPNPKHHPEGDFTLDHGKIVNTGKSPLTFSGIALYHPRFFQGCTAGKFSVVPLLKAAMSHQRISGERFEGYWTDTGTPERLEETRAYLEQASES